MWLVRLAELTEGALIPQAVAAALGVPEQPGRPLTDTLVDGLRSKEMLLVLDNCEHLIDAAARLLDILLDSCPRLRVLATSRESLGVAGEVRWHIPALSCPTRSTRPRWGSWKAMSRRDSSSNALPTGARASRLHPITPRALLRSADNSTGYPWPWSWRQHG